MEPLKYIVAILYIHSCTSQKFYYKQNGNEYDVYYGPSSLMGYQEMMAPKSFKPSYNERGVRPGKCQNANFNCNEEYSYIYTRNFECHHDYQCPKCFKCCQPKCFTHKVCQPAITDPSEQLTTSRDVETMTTEQPKITTSQQTSEILSTKNPVTTIITTQAPKTTKIISTTSIATPTSRRNITTKPTELISTTTITTTTTSTPTVTIFRTSAPTSDIITTIQPKTTPLKTESTSIPSSNYITSVIITARTTTPGKEITTTEKQTTDFATTVIPSSSETSTKEEQTTTTLKTTKISTNKMHLTASSQENTTQQSESTTTGEEITIASVTPVLPSYTVTELMPTLASIGFDANKSREDLTTVNPVSTIPSEEIEITSTAEIMSTPEETQKTQNNTGVPDSPELKKVTVPGVSGKSNSKTTPQLETDDEHFVAGSGSTNVISFSTGTSTTTEQTTTVRTTELPTSKIHTPASSQENTPQQSEPTITKEEITTASVTPVQQISTLEELMVTLSGIDFDVNKSRADLTTRNPISTIPSQEMQITSPVEIMSTPEETRKSQKNTGVPDELKKVTDPGVTETRQFKTTPQLETDDEDLVAGSGSGDGATFFDNDDISTKTTTGKFSKEADDENGKNSENLDFVPDKEPAVMLANNIVPSEKKTSISDFDETKKITPSSVTQDALINVTTEKSTNNVNDKEQKNSRKVNVVPDKESTILINDTDIISTEKTTISDFDESKIVIASGVTEKNKSKTTLHVDTDDEDLVDGSGSGNGAITFDNGHVSTKDTKEKSSNEAVDKNDNNSRNSEFLPDKETTVIFASKIIPSEKTVNNIRITNFDESKKVTTSGVTEKSKSKTISYLEIDDEDLVAGSGSGDGVIYIDNEDALIKVTTGKSNDDANDEERKNSTNDTVHSENEAPKTIEKQNKETTSSVTKNSNTNTTPRLGTDDADFIVGSGSEDEAENSDTSTEKTMAFVSTKASTRTFVDGTEDQDFTQSAPYKVYEQINDDDHREGTQDGTVNISTSSTTQKVVIEKSDLDDFDIDDTEEGRENEPLTTVTEKKPSSEGKEYQELKLVMSTSIPYNEGTTLDRSLLFPTKEVTTIGISIEGKEKLKPKEYVKENSDETDKTIQNKPSYSREENKNKPLEITDKISKKTKEYFDTEIDYDDNEEEDVLTEASGSGDYVNVPSN